MLFKDFVFHFTFKRYLYNFQFIITTFETKSVREKFLLMKNRSLCSAAVGLCVNMIYLLSSSLSPTCTHTHALVIYVLTFSLYFFRFTPREARKISLKFSQKVSSWKISSFLFFFCPVLCTTNSKSKLKENPHDFPVTTSQMYFSRVRSYFGEHMQTRRDLARLAALAMIEQRSTFPDRQLFLEDFRVKTQQHDRRRRENFLRLCSCGLIHTRTLWVYKNRACSTSNFNWLSFYYTLRRRRK